MWMLCHDMPTWVMERLAVCILANLDLKCPAGPAQHLDLSRFEIVHQARTVFIM